MASQQMHKAVTDLCKGSSPTQLANLELDVQQQFKAPSFAALGHGSSLLQLCRQDETVMKTITSRGQSVAPLAHVSFASCGCSCGFPCGSHVEGLLQTERASALSVAVSQQTSCRYRDQCHVCELQQSALRLAQLHA